MVIILLFADFADITWQIRDQRWTALLLLLVSLQKKKFQPLLFLSLSQTRTHTHSVSFIDDSHARTHAHVQPLFFSYVYIHISITCIYTHTLSLSLSPAYVLVGASTCCSPIRPSISFVRACREYNFTIWWIARDRVFSAVGSKTSTPELVRSFVWLKQPRSKKVIPFESFLTRKARKWWWPKKWGIGEGGSEQRLAETFQPTHFVFGWFFFLSSSEDRSCEELSERWDRWALVRQLVFYESGWMLLSGAAAADDGCQSFLKRDKSDKEKSKVCLTRTARSKFRKILNPPKFLAIFNFA